MSKHIEPEGGIASTPSTKRYLHERTRVIDPDPIFGPGPFSGGWVTSVFPVVGPPTWRRALTLALPQGDAGEASLDEPVDDVTLRRLRRVPFLVCFPCVLPRIPLLVLGFLVSPSWGTWQEPTRLLDLRTRQCGACPFEHRDTGIADLVKIDLRKEG